MTILSEIDQNSRKKKRLKFNSARYFLPWLLVLLTVAGMILQLRWQGRIWWCKLGDYSLWSSDAWSSHNSQHLFDPYSFTHILHGVLYFWLISLVFRKMSLVWRFFLAIVIAMAWEILENTNAVIEHYRTATLALNYFGDSVFNSFGDVLSAAVGFWIAYKLRFWRVLALFVLMEIVLLIWIRDSLLVNIILLIYPIEVIKTWQGS